MLSLNVSISCLIIPVGLSKCLTFRRYEKSSPPPINSKTLNEARKNIMVRDRQSGAHNLCGVF